MSVNLRRFQQKNSLKYVILLSLIGPFKIKQQQKLSAIVMHICMNMCVLLHCAFPLCYGGYIQGGARNALFCLLSKIFIFMSIFSKYLLNVLVKCQEILPYRF